MCERQDIEQSDHFLHSHGMADNHFAFHLIYNTYYKILNRQIPYKHTGLCKSQFLWCNTQYCMYER
jgi:hypothetical protein